MEGLKRWRKQHTTHAKISAVANIDPPKPSRRPTPIARAVTVAEWDDGMPPEPRSCLKSHRLSLYLQHLKTLRF